MLLIERRIYKTVSSNSIERDEYIPANGETIGIKRVGGNALPRVDTSVSIIWDRSGAPEIILNTYGDIIQDLRKTIFVGDGVKSITIQLTNNTENDLVLGGFWSGISI